MRLPARLLLTLTLLMPVGGAVGQQMNGDSLLAVLKDSRLPDSTRIRAASHLCLYVHLRNRPDSALHYAQLGLEMMGKQDMERRRGILLYGKGEALSKLNRTAEALKAHEAGLAIREKLGNSDDISASLTSIGNIYQTQGDHTKAIDFMTRSMEICEKAGNLIGVASGFVNIGNMHLTQKDDSAAYDSYNKALRILEKTDDKFRLGITYMNIGNILHNWNDLDGAIHTYEKSLAMQTEVDDRHGMAGSLSNIGLVLQDKGDLDGAMRYMEQAVPLYEGVGSKKGLGQTLSSMGVIYRMKGNLPKALELGERALELVKDAGSVNRLKNISYDLFLTYEAMGRYKQALETYKLHIEMRDSLMSTENQRGLIKQQTKYEFERQEALNKVEQEKKDAIAAEQLKQRSQQRNALLVGVLLTLGLAGVSYRSYAIKKRDNALIWAKNREVEAQNALIHQQKTEVERRNAEILESIAYARKLQEAVLPPPKVVKDFFSDSFLLYLPRDIVSGDFYWMESKTSPKPSLPGGEQGSISYFAVGDCTGHGVPGAMLSVMGLNGLNRALNELHLIEPKDLLTQLTKDLKDAFEHNESTVRDGMDIALCALDTETLMLTYCGANNPLWIIRGEEVIQLRPNKRPVGFYEIEVAFGQETVQLEKGDIIYLHSDGYQDQYGGPENKKFMTKRYRDLLLTISKQPIQRQREMLLKEHRNWKGDHDQTDDICVMAVRV
jgi:tetratricopeptide (TPR) repeat protein